MDKKRIIIITDGDLVAKQAVEIAGDKLGLRTISTSAGNPSIIPIDELKDKIMETPKDPVLIMVDDAGERGKGSGENILEALVQEQRFQLLGVIAVASNTVRVKGVSVNLSITREGKIIKGPVDKEGNPETTGRVNVAGDTVDVLNGLDIPFIVGVGDLGKMEKADDVENGANITTMAIKEILKFHGLYEE